MQKINEHTAEHGDVWANLAQAGRQPGVPWAMTLPNGAGTLRVERWLRVLPGRRYVGVAFRNKEGVERKVLAKLFVGARAERDFEREKKGVSLLAAQELDTPPLVAALFSGGKGGALLFDYLEDSHSVGARFQDIERLADRDARQSALLKEALRLVARLHARGLWQEDLHLDNLLYWREHLYLVDGGGICAEHPGKPLSVPKTRENLGVFFAQLPSRFETSLESFLESYAQGNPSYPWRSEGAALTAAIDRARRVRLRDLMKKTGRDCSLFSVKKNGPFAAFGMRVVRRDACDALARIMDHPDAFIARGHVYKAGGTATVARVEDGGHSFVIKRYNIKHFWHWLNRCWRPSRAWTSWREGNRLLALGIPTAKPLAVIERRCFGLRGVAFLITEYLEGQDIMARFHEGTSGEGGTREPSEAEWAALRELFSALRRERISHGDFKGHNLIWQGLEARGCWALIDLDAMRAHQSLSGFARAHARDCARFLRNWPPESPLFRFLEKHSPADTNERI